MNKQLILGSLALDLRRVAQAYYRGSNVVGERFMKEAIARKQELDGHKIKPHLQKLLLKIEQLMSEKDHKKLAEDALTYSVIFQNAAIISS